MEEKKKSMTKDEMIMELMELLKANGRPKQAADVFESAAYVDMLESKLDQMTNELLQMRKELQEMKEQQASKSLLFVNLFDADLFNLFGSINLHFSQISQ